MQARTGEAYSQPLSAGGHIRSFKSWASSLHWGQLILVLVGLAVLFLVSAVFALEALDQSADAGGVRRYALAGLTVAALVMFFSILWIWFGSRGAQRVMSPDAIDTHSRWFLRASIAALFVIALHLYSRLGDVSEAADAAADAADAATTRAHELESRVEELESR